MSNAPAQHRSNLIGIGLMVLNGLCISVIYLLMKQLTMDISSHLALFLYKLTLWFAILPWCLYKGGFSNLKTKRFWLHASRGFLSISGGLCLFFSIKHVALSDATAIGYLEQVLLVIIGILYFKEPSSKTKVFGIFTALMGAFIVVYPDIISFSQHSFIPDFFYNGGFKEFNYYYTFVFLSILFWAANCTVIKVLGKTDTPKVQLFYNLMISCIIAAPLAFLSWQPVEGFGALKLPTRVFSFEELGLKEEHLFFLLALGVMYFLHSMAFMNSLKVAEMSTVMPFMYTNIVFAGLLGYTYFSEVPSEASQFGYVLIVAAGIVLLRSEARKKRKLKEMEIRKLQEKFDNA